MKIIKRLYIYIYIIFREFCNIDQTFKLYYFKNAHIHILHTYIYYTHQIERECLKLLLTT